MKMPKNDEPNIVFSERDSRGIKQPHDDPLVILLRMKEFNIHRVLIDNGSSADVIYLLAGTYPAHVTKKSEETKFWQESAAKLP